MAQKEKKQETYRVYDTKAPDGATRSHDIIVQTYTDGREPTVKTYKLSRDTPVEMPVEHAMKFLIDSAFRVEREDGQVVSAPPRHDPTLPLRIGPDETIARFDELNKSALYKRVKLLPGSESVSIDSPIQKLVDFLVEKRRQQLHGNMTQGEQQFYEQAQSGQLGGALSGSEADGLFGDEGRDFIENVNRAAA